MQSVILVQMLDALIDRKAAAIAATVLIPVEVALSRA
jgi:hypothetical protein